MHIDQKQFRQTLSQFVSGITIVTTQFHGQCHGTTVSSFCSLSLDPPLILVCLNHQSASNALIQASSTFGVNILAEGEAWMAKQFAHREASKFANVAYHNGTLGTPLLDDALATLECRLIAHYPGGDHTIFLGEVIALQRNPEKRPLVYFDSQYARIMDLVPLANH